MEIKKVTILHFRVIYIWFDSSMETETVLMTVFLNSQSLLLQRTFIFLGMYDIGKSLIYQHRDAYISN